MREVDEDAEPVALGDRPLAELGQTVVLRSFGLEVAKGVADEMHELDVAHAQVVGGFQAADVALDEHRALDR